MIPSDLLLGVVSQSSHCSFHLITRCPGNKLIASCPGNYITPKAEFLKALQYHNCMIFLHTYSLVPTPFILYHMISSPISKNNPITPDMEGCPQASTGIPAQINIFAPYVTNLPLMITYMGSREWVTLSLHWTQLLVFILVVLSLIDTGIYTAILNQTPPLHHSYPPLIHLETPIILWCAPQSQTWSACLGQPVTSQ